MMNRTKEYINNQMQSLRRDVIASRFTSASSKTYLQYLLYFINTHIDQEETARSTIEKCFTLLDNEYWQGGISQNVYDRFITNLFDLETTIIEYHFAMEIIKYE